MPKLYGYTKLELAREKKVNGRIHRNVVKRIQKHNDLTGYIEGVHKEGNYGYLIPNNKLVPVTQFLDGCVLTDKANNSSVGMIAHDATITACAGKDAYSGTNAKRGSFNSIESGLITSPNGYKGIRNVWDWSTSQGNGTISSLGLCRHQLAIAEYSDSAVPDVECCEELFNLQYSGADYNRIGSLHIIDYEKEVGYRVRYDSGSIYVDEYQLACKNDHVVARPFIYDSSAPTYLPEFIGTHTISQSVDYFNDYSSSISYTGDKIVIITWSGSNIKAYPITISDWSMGTVVSKTFNGVVFANGGTGWNSGFHKDVALIDGIYVWILGTVSNVYKMLKIDLFGDTVAVAEKSVPSVIDNANQGVCMLMPNGDFYKLPSVGQRLSALYYHNGNFYAVKIPEAFNCIGNSANVIAGANANLYGTSLITFADNSYSMVGNLHIPTFHGWLSTINDLEESVIKSADLTMKLTYEITEVAG